MKPIVEEWVLDADADLRVTEVVLRQKDEREGSKAAFFAHQCAEKYFKALIMEHGIEPPKSHNLERLLQCIPPHEEPLWTNHLNGLKSLTRFGMETRYPGEIVTREDARVAIQIAREIRALIRERLGLET